MKVRSYRREFRKREFQGKKLFLKEIYRKKFRCSWDESYAATFIHFKGTKVPVLVRITSGDKIAEQQPFPEPVADFPKL